MTHHAPTPPYGNTAHALVTPGFGGRLMRARIAAGFTSQPKLARAAGLSVNTVCRHEVEKIPPSLQAITSYARVLNVSAAYLQYGLGDPSIPSAVTHYLCTMRGLLLHPSTRAKVIAFPWSLVAEGDELTEPQVHAIARVVDGFVREREHRLDGHGLPSGDEPLSDGTGEGHASSHRRAAASA